MQVVSQRQDRQRHSQGQDKNQEETETMLTLEYFVGGGVALFALAVLFPVHVVAALATFFLIGLIIGRMQ